MTSQIEGGDKVDAVDKLLRKYAEFKETGKYKKDRPDDVVDVKDAVTLLSELNPQPAIVTRTCVARYKKAGKEDPSPLRLEAGTLLYFLCRYDYLSSYRGKKAIYHSDLVIGVVTDMLHARAPTGCIRLLTPEEIVQFKGHPQLAGISSNAPVEIGSE